MISLFQYNRIAAAFLVLLIHLPFQPSTPFVSGLKNSAVPLFACMAGYLYKGEIGKKFGRIFIPYCIWAVVYFLANNVLFDVLVKRQQFCFPGLDAWLLGGTAAHLWFLPSLLAAFALTSVVRLFGATGVRSRLAWGGVLLALGAATQFLPVNALGPAVEYVRLYFGRLLLFFSIGWMLRPLLRDRGGGGKGDGGRRRNLYSCRSCQSRAWPSLWAFMAAASLCRRHDGFVGRLRNIPCSEGC